MTATGLMAAPFPEPPGVIARLLDELRLAAAATDETEHESRRVAMLSRPWDPPSCPPEIRRNVYLWLDDVVAWINEDHTWRTDRVVPICWDLHPHIVHELATVDLPALGGDLRAYAGRSGGVAPIHPAGVPRARRRPDRRDGVPTGAAPAEPRRRPERDLPGRRRASSSAESTVAGRGVEFTTSRKNCRDGAREPGPGTSAEASEVREAARLDR